MITELLIPCSISRLHSCSNNPRARMLRQLLLSYKLRFVKLFRILSGISGFFRLETKQSQRREMTPFFLRGEMFSSPDEPVRLERMDVSSV